MIRQNKNLEINYECRLTPQEWTERMKENGKKLWKKMYYPLRLQGLFIKKPLTDMAFDIHIIQIVKDYNRLQR